MSGILQSLAALKAAGGGGPTFPSISVTDNLNRANASPIDSPWSSIPVWNGIGMCRIVSNVGCDYVNDNADPNVINEDGFNFDRVSQFMDSLGDDYRDALAAYSGESLWITLCMVVNDNSDSPFLANNPAEYAEFVFYFVDKFTNTYGYQPNAFQICLEPDVHGAFGADWDDTDNEADCTLAARARLDAEGYTDVQLIGLSYSNATLVLGAYNAMVAHDGDYATAIDFVDYHRYDQLPNDAQLAALRDGVGGKPLIMGEYLLADHDDLYQDLAVARVCAWQKFAICFPQPGTPGNTFNYFIVDNGDFETVTLEVGSNLLRQYMKYVRMGAVMKGVTNSSSNFQGVPFQNANGSYVVPIRCQTSGEINVKNLPDGTYQVRYTANDESPADTQIGSNQEVSGGSDVTFTMPEAGVVTVFDVNYLASANPVRHYFATASPRG